VRPRHLPTVFYMQAGMVVILAACLGKLEAPLRMK